MRDLESKLRVLISELPPALNESKILSLIEKHAFKSSLNESDLNAKIQTKIDTIIKQAKDQEVISQQREKIVTADIS